MPSRTKRVRFETEYNSSFKAFDPDIYKSPLISALIDEPRSNKLDKTKTPAGLKSDKFSKSDEPPLQSKSKAVVRHDKASQTILNNDKRYREAKDDLNSVKIPGNKTKKNRALEYKAGLKTDNSLKQTKFPVSEYQREYEWKKSAIGDSPLLNAEKIVFDSHTNIPRFIRDKVPRKTEYQSRFTDDETRQVARKEKKEYKDENEENEDKPTSAAKRLLQTSHNPDPPFFPHGSNRVIHTEYQANFGSPKKYQYEEGIWLGAKPPHLLPDDESTIGSNERITNWFEEVLELRAKARHYKTRALEGNYFSREYLAQLDAELEQLYEEPGDPKKKRKSGHGDAASQQHSSELGRPPPRVKHAWESKDNSENDDINDGKKVYRDLNEQFKDVASDGETISSRSEHGSLDSGHGSERIKNKNRIKPSLSKTVNQKYPPTLHPTTTAVQTTQGDSLLEDKSGHSEDSGSVNEHNTNYRHRTKPSLSKTVNRKLSPKLHHGTTKPAIATNKDAVLMSNISNGSDASSELSAKTDDDSKESNYDSPDKFNIRYIQGMHSNDFEAPSTSVRSNYGSESERLSKTEYDNGSCLSQSSLASRESMARQTLAHAKQRKNSFW